MKEDNEIDNEISEIAYNRAEATVYSLNNKYVNNEDKQKMEMWFQLPGNIMNITFWIMVVMYIKEPFHWSYFFIIPIIIDVIIGLINWKVYFEKLLDVLYFTILHSIILTVIAILISIYSFYNGYILLGILILLSRFGIFTFLEFHMIIYSGLSRRFKMHPKYVFLKKFYGYEFPFEKYL